MGQKFRDEAGNIWEQGPDGQPRLVSQAQGGPNVVVPAAPPEPKFIPGSPGYVLGPGGAEPIPGLPPEPPKKPEPTFIPGKPGYVVTPGGSAAPIPGLPVEPPKADPKSGAYNALQQQIDRVNEIYRQNLQGGAPNVINNIIPDFLQPKVDAFDSASQGLVNPFMAAFKVPGQGSQSDTELKQFLAANTPAQGDSDEVIEEKIRNIQTRLNAEVPAKPQEKMDRSAPLMGGGAQEPQLTGSTDGFRDEIDPVLKGVAGRLGKMMAAGASDKVILEFLNNNGVSPSNTNILPMLQYRRSPEYKAWQRANPGKAYPVDPGFYTKKIPLSTSQKIGNAAAQSGLGAYAINAAQGATAGHLDELASALGGDGEAVNTGVQYSRSASPNASFAGDMAGQALLQGSVGRFVPGLNKLPNSSVGRVGEDLLYGAAYGHGEGDTLGGAVSSAVGGKAFRGLGRAGGVAMRGVNASPSLRYLNDAEVPLTIGRIGRGTGSTVGNAIGGLEDRAAGFPIFDAIINSARQRGDEGFNRAGFREMGGSGATGAQGVVEGKGLVDNAYSFLDSSKIPLDAQFAGSQAGVRASLPGLPSFGPEIGKSLDKIDIAAKGGELAGRDWQSALRSAKRNSSSIKSREFSGDAVDALGDVERNLLDLAARQGPPGSAGQLADANKLNMDFRTITSALDNGPTQARGELFSASRLDTASRDAARKFGGQVKSMSGQRPFYDLTKAGMDVMPNLTPDSGTAGRAIFYSALPGLVGGGVGAGVGAATDAGAGEGAALGSGYGSTLLPTLALTALYSKTGQKGLQKALLGPRPQWAKDLDAITKDPRVKAFVNKRMAGMFGSAAARDLYLLPELEQ